MTVQPFLDWLSGLPPLALYLALAVTAAIENVFPPLPADTVVAFGSFLAARGHGTAFGSFLSTWVGNVAGAMLMYFAGRRFGADRLAQRLGGGESARRRLDALYGRHGIWALCLSRFLPAVRAIVPPFAGALRIPPVKAGAAMAAASAIWYGAITYLAFQVGSSWEQLTARVAVWGRTAGVVAVAVVLAALALWYLRRRRTA
jgi:membrane protein DedA with SNARE-associated domain